jgi:putative hydrolase of the HAD superfamily
VPVNAWSAATPARRSTAPRAILLDFYGTLTTACTRGPDHSRSAELLGCQPEDYFAVLDTSFYPRCQGRYGDALQTMRWVADELGVRPTDARLRAAQAARLIALRADTRLRPEAVVTLRRLRLSGVGIAVVSDCAWELPEIMPSLPVAPFLDAAVYSVVVGQTKPHPAMYETACEKLRVDPADCVYIGDGGSHELTGAQDIGIPAIRLAAPDLGSHLLFGADNGFHGPAAQTLPEAVELARAGAFNMSV